MSSQVSSRRSKRASTTASSSQIFPSSSRANKRTRSKTYNSSASSSAGQERFTNAVQNDVTSQVLDEVQQDSFEESDQEDDSEQDEIVMAVDYRQSRLGCSFYNQVEQKLYVVADMEVNLTGSLNYIGLELFRTRESLHLDTYSGESAERHSAISHQSSGYTLSISSRWDV